MHSAPLLSAEGAKEAAHLLLADRRPVSAVPVARVDDDVVAEGAQLLQRIEHRVHVRSR